jgi:alpha-L-rhamnosidase
MAMTVLDQTSYPGFGYEISQGATTDWEQWTYASNMESHDHAMFAGINASFYTDLAGITATAPGYAAISIAPQIPAGLNHVAASISTVRGTVSSAWTRTGRSFQLDVTVPVNTTATVSVPLFGGSANATRATPGATFTRIENGCAEYRIGSGHWRFTR